MGFLDRFRSGGMSKANTSLNPVPRSEWVQWGSPVNVVVGEDHYQDTFVELLGEPRQEGYLQLVPVTFTREPDNQYDPNALQAMLGEFHVGYLRREQAAETAPLLDAAGVAEFTVAGLVRGADTGYYGSDKFSIQIWPKRLMTKGPIINVDPSRDEWSKVRWPPFAKEGRPEFDVVCDYCGSFQLYERPDGLYYCRRCKEVSAGN